MEHINNIRSTIGMKFLLRNLYILGVISGVILVSGVIFTATAMDIHGPPGLGPRLQPLPANSSEPPIYYSRNGSFKIKLGDFDKFKTENTKTLKFENKTEMKSDEGEITPVGSLSANGFSSMAMGAGMYMLMASLIGIRATKTGFYPLKITFLAMMGTVLFFLISFSILLEYRSSSLKKNVVRQLKLLKRSGLYDVMEKLHNEYECCGADKGIEDLEELPWVKCTYKTPCADVIMDTFTSARTKVHVIFGLISFYILFLLLLNCHPKGFKPPVVSEYVKPSGLMSL